MNPDVLADLAASTEDEVVALVARWRAGELTDEEFVALATAALERSQAEATAVADLAVGAALGKGALGLLVPRAAGRRARALARGWARLEIEWRPTGLAERVRYLDVLREELKVPGQDRLYYVSRNDTLRVLEQVVADARDEVLATGQEAGGEAIKRHGAWWRRRTNTGACEMCQDLARSSGDLHGSVPIYRHRGCGCTQTPIPADPARAN